MPAPDYGIDKIIPFFHSTDIPATIAFYRDVLHFDFMMAWPKEATEANGFKDAVFAALAIGKNAAASVYFMSNIPRGSMATIGMSEQGLEAYHKSLVSEGKLGELSTEEGAKGVGIGKIEDKPWGLRQFDVRDTGDNVLTFFAVLPMTG